MMCRFWMLMAMFAMLHGSLDYGGGSTAVQAAAKRNSYVGGFTVQSSCTPGHYYFNGTCLPCPPGSYQPDSNPSNTTNCTLCSPGYFENSTGASACTFCPKDYIQPDYGGTACTICNGTKWVSNIDRTECVKNGMSAGIVGLILGLGCGIAFVLILIGAIVFWQESKARARRNGNQ